MLSTPWKVLERGQQVGITVAAGVAPTTFAGSLSERSWLDQGLVTGLSTGTQYLVTVTAQDALDLAARGLAGSFAMSSRWSDDRRATVAATVCQGLVVPLGFGVAAWLDRSGPLTSRRALLRQATWRIGLTGLAGSLLGMGTVATRSLDEAVGAGGRIAAIPLGGSTGLGYLPGRRRSPTAFGAGVPRHGPGVDSSAAGTRGFGGGGPRRRGGGRR